MLQLYLRTLAWRSVRFRFSQPRAAAGPFTLRVRGYVMSASPLLRRIQERRAAIDGYGAVCDLQDPSKEQSLYDDQQ